MIILNYQRQLWGVYASMASQIGNDAIKGAAQNPIGVSPSGQPLVFNLDGVIGAVYDVSNRLMRFFDECTRMQSPFEMAFPRIDPIEVIVRKQSGNYHSVPQNTYLTYVRDGSGPIESYHPLGGPKKSRSSRMYTGENSRRSRNGGSKKPSKGPVLIHQNRLKRNSRLPLVRHSTAARML